MKTSNSHLQIMRAQARINRQPESAQWAFETVLSKNFQCPDTGNIPDRLLLSSACFRFFPAKQMYSYLSLASKNKSLYNPMWISVWCKSEVLFFKEKKNQKKKEEKEWASPMNLFD